jgi:hypothetical protein
MTAFSESFRSEVARIARKEVKDDVSSLRKAVTACLSIRNRCAQAGQQDSGGATSQHGQGHRKVTFWL